MYVSFVYNDQTSIVQLLWNSKNTGILITFLDVLVAQLIFLIIYIISNWYNTGWVQAWIFLSNIIQLLHLNEINMRFYGAEYNKCSNCFITYGSI